jgi:hypothetical protein
VERICVSKDHPHRRTKLLIELSRGVPMRILHESSLDKRQALIRAKSKSSKVAQRTFLNFFCRPLGSIHDPEDATGEGWQEFVGAV